MSYASPVDVDAQPNGINGLGGSSAPRQHDRFARDGLLTVTGTAFSQIAGVALVYALAQVLSQRDVGVYSQAFAVRAMLMLVAGLGMRVTMTQFVAVAHADRDGGLARGHMRIGLASSAIASIVVAAVLAFVAQPLATNQFDEPALTTPLRLMALSLPFIVVMTSAVAASQGFQTMRAYTAVSLLFEPGVRLLLTLACLAAGFGIIAALGSVLVASVFAAAVALIALHRLSLTLPEGQPRYRPREIAGFSRYSWVASIATQGLMWADIIMLGMLSTSEDVAVYQIASRVVLLATVFVTPLTASYSPRVAHTHRLGLLSDLRRYYRQTSSWTFALSAPLIGGAAVFAGEVLSVFGDQYRDGRVVIWILMAGSLMESLSAPAAVTLNQTGLNRLNMIINSSALALNIGLNAVLIPILGLEGAAIAWLVTLLGPGLSRVWFVKRRVTHVWGITSMHTAASVSLGAATGVGIVCRLVLPWDGLTGMLVGGAAFLLVYAAGLAWSLRRDEEFAMVVPGPINGLLGRARRWRRRRHLDRLPSGTHPIRIWDLVSPFRYDIVVRGRFFEFAAQQESLWRTDPDRFAELAWEGPYGIWYRLVAVKSIGLDPDDERVVRSEFDKRVASSMRLLDSYHRAGGFDPTHPITVRPYDADTMPSGVRLRTSRFLPLDGCHRLALLLAEGRTDLEPHEYRVESRSAPLLDNTAHLSPALGIEDDVYARFVAAGFTDELIDDVETLLARVAEHDPPLASDVAAMIARHRGTRVAPDATPARDQPSQAT